MLSKLKMLKTANPTAGTQSAGGFNFGPLSGALIGAGLGGVWGLINEMLRDPNERNYALGILPYLVGGGALGAGVGGLYQLMSSGVQDGNSGTKKLQRALANAVSDKERARIIRQEAENRAYLASNNPFDKAVNVADDYALYGGVPLAAAGGLSLGIDWLGGKLRGRKVPRFGRWGGPIMKGGIIMTGLGLMGKMYDSWGGIGSTVPKYELEILEELEKAGKKEGSFSKLKLLKQAKEESSGEKSSAIISPTWKGALIGAGLGGVGGLLSEWWKDKEDRNWWNALIPAGLGGLLGAGIGGLYSGEAGSKSNGSGGSLPKIKQDKVKGEKEPDFSNYDRGFGVGDVGNAAARHLAYHVLGTLGRRMMAPLPPSSQLMMSVYSNPGATKGLRGWRQKLRSSRFAPKIHKGIGLAQAIAHGADVLYTIDRWWRGY